MGSEPFGKILFWSIVFRLTKLSDTPERELSAIHDIIPIVMFFHYINMACSISESLYLRYALCYAKNCSNTIFQLDTSSLFLYRRTFFVSIDVLVLYSNVFVYLDGMGFWLLCVRFLIFLLKNLFL